MLLRHVALGDCDETCQPRFGSEQIEIGIVETAFADVVTDGEDLALFVEQKLEVHFIKSLLTLLRDLRQTRRETPGRFRGLLDRFGHRLEFGKGLEPGHRCLWSADTRVTLFKLSA